MTNPSPVSHIGVTVGDVRRAMDFYCRVLGATVARPVGQLTEEDNTIVARGVGVPTAQITVGFVSFGNTMVEFLQYDPPGEAFERSNGDVGSTHICLQVDDIDEIYERLVSEGVKFVTSVNELHGMTDAPNLRWVYFKDPDNITVELSTAPFWPEPIMKLRRTPL